MVKKLLLNDYCCWVIVLGTAQISMDLQRQHSCVPTGAPVIGLQSHGLEVNVNATEVEAQHRTTDTTEQRIIIIKL